MHFLSAGGGGGVEPSTKFSKKEVLTGSQFVEEVVGKERCDLFQGGGGGGGCKFYIKKLKSEIFNERNSFINKNAFLCHN